MKVSKRHDLHPMKTLIVFEQNGFVKTDSSSNSMIFYDGASFHCPKDKSTVMFFQCGQKNKLKYVLELTPCTYKFVVDVKCVRTNLFFS